MSMNSRKLMVDSKWLDHFMTIHKNKKLKQ